MRKIGVIGVDSGQIVITDPAYMGTDGGAGLPNFDKILNMTNRNPTAQIKNELGIKIAVASRTGLGDGVYPVYAIEGHIGDKRLGKRVKKLIIDFAPKEIVKVQKAVFQKSMKKVI
jgi:hypothetical protein